MHLIQQFFLPKELKRLNELIYCLKKNINNPLIETIHLLNEEVYDLKPYGIKNNKVIQFNLKKRLTFKSAFDTKSPRFLD